MKGGYGGAAMSSRIMLLCGLLLLIRGAFAERLFAQNGQMMVPLHFIADSYGAAMRVTPTEQTAALTLNGKTVELKLNSATFTIDGKPYRLPTPRSR